MVFVSNGFLVPPLCHPHPCLQGEELALLPVLTSLGIKALPAFQGLREEAMRLILYPLPSPPSASTSPMVVAFCPSCAARAAGTQKKATFLSAGECIAKTT